MPVTTRAAIDAVDGPAEAGELRLRVRAAPADGAANEAVIRLIAASIGVPKSAVSISRGATSRHKLLAVDGGDLVALRARWPGLRINRRDDQAGSA